MVYNHDRNVIQPERNRGRPKKYHNNEDKRLACTQTNKRMYVEKSFSM